MTDLTHFPRKQELSGTEGLTPKQLAEGIASGGRFVVFEYCISFIFITSRSQTTKIYYIAPGKNAVIKSLPFCFITLLLGWWGLPFGPIYSLAALGTNLRGGKDVTNQVQADSNGGAPGSTLHLNTDAIEIEGVRLSASYADFNRGAVTDNEQGHPGLGFTIAYHGGEKGEGTIYIYDKASNDIPDGPASPPTRKEFEQAIRDIASIAGRSIELIGTYGTGSPKRGMEFLCAEFRLSDTKGRRRTFLYLTATGGRFVKLRVTLRNDDETDATARNFADAVAIGLWRTQGDR